MSNDRRNGLRIIIPSSPPKKGDEAAREKSKSSVWQNVSKFHLKKLSLSKNILSPSSVRACVFDYDKWYLHRQFNFYLALDKS
ncbi:hypothetical protein TNIN_309011 [Trichonephila inaurata madagascariensis]|uniref:Uncharacterized protein n=1 Tax=Trichonephila inaurata madagascariensis TaxID=2747483 RepID=A0A8X6YPH0_9ARAC|nr:hypothetical protein TNIN_309011 [Trichonephila inaurata madagascariensis]